MEWVKRMQRALSYVEEHLTSDLRAEEVAREANSSAFNFQRMFVMLTGVTVAEYVHRRRLTMAARYRYESQASFTRAFGRMDGFAAGVVGDRGSCDDLRGFQGPGHAATAGD